MRGPWEPVIYSLLVRSTDANLDLQLASEGRGRAVLWDCGLNLWDLILSSGRECQNWIVRHSAGIETCLAVWGTPCTLGWSGESCSPCCCALISWPTCAEDQGRIHSFRNFSSDIPSALNASAVYSISISNSFQTYPSTDPCGGPPIPDPFTVFYISVTRLAFTRWVKPETKIPSMTLSSVINYKSWQYHFQTSFKPFSLSSFLLPPQPHWCPIVSLLDNSSS